MKSLSLPLSLGALLAPSLVAAAYNEELQDPLPNANDFSKYRAACPDYKQYSTRPQYAQ